MRINELETGGGHELLLTCADEASGYRGVIAVHSTRLGPAVGGARFWDYASEREAVTDALRLSRGMTYKNALAGLPLGGGKSVIIGDNRISLKGGERGTPCRAGEGTLRLGGGLSGADLCH